MTRTRWWVALLSLGAAVAASYWVIRSTWPAEGAPLGLPWRAHLLLLCVVGAEIVFRVFKLTCSAAAVSVPLRPGVAARTILGGDFGAAITPSRSGAEPARYLVLAESGMRPTDAVVVLFLELVLELVSLGVVAIVLGIGLGSRDSMIRGLVITVVVYAVAIAAVTAAALAVSRRASQSTPRWFARLGGGDGLWRRVAGALARVREGRELVRRSNVLWLSVALVLSVGHILMRLATLPVIVAAYAGTAPTRPLLLWPLVLLYGAAIAPAPGGGGVVELAFKTTLAGALPARLVPTSLIWWRVYSFYIYVVLGALAAGGTVLRALRERQPTPPPDAP